MQKIAALMILLCVAACGPAAEKERVREAIEKGRLAREGFERSDRYLRAWLKEADPASGLIPRNLSNSRDVWNGKDAAADNYAWLVLTAWFTDRALFEGRMHEMLAAESRLTARLDRLPEAYSFSKKSWLRESFDLDATIFDAAEYVKDGLLPVTEWIGPSAWSERMTGIVDDIWKHAAVETPFGKIPSLNQEVNGDLLQACSRLFWFTGQRRHLEQAIRLGDHYLLGTNNPVRDVRRIVMGDHACEVFNGLAELYAACAFAAPEKREAYRAPIHAMFDRILEVARDEHGMFFGTVDAKTGKPGEVMTDNWGYTCDGLYTLYLVDKTEAYRDAVLKALGCLKAHYTGYPWQNGGMDGYADSIEGAITLLNREHVASAEEWIDSEIKTLWAKQQPNGIIEGWHADGNFARTSLMYSLWKTQGTTIHPWRSDIKFGALREKDGLFIALRTQEPWSGKLVFDHPRHHKNMKLPLDYPRINQFPEWFVVDTGRTYKVTQGWRTKTVSGETLRSGLPIKLDTRETTALRITL